MPGQSRRPSRTKIVVAICASGVAANGCPGPSSECGGRRTTHRWNSTPENLDTAPNRPHNRVSPPSRGRSPELAPSDTPLQRIAPLQPKLCNPL